MMTLIKLRNCNSFLLFDVPYSRCPDWNSVVMAIPRKCAMSRRTFCPSHKKNKEKLSMKMPKEIKGGNGEGRKKKLFTANSR